MGSTVTVDSVTLSHLSSQLTHTHIITQLL